MVAISLMLVSFASAGLFDGLKNAVTGKASSQNTDAEVNITGSNDLQIISVSAISAQDPTEESSTTVAFTVTAYDADGVDDINDTSINATFSSGVEDDRSTGAEGTCTHNTDTDSFTATYDCSIDMWYWDGAGSWTVTVQGKDLGTEVIAYNDSTSFTYNQLKAMVISPSELLWSGLTTGDENALADNNPTEVNNTGNYDSTIDLTGNDLAGESTPSIILASANFTVNVANACEGTELNNTQLTTVPSSDANKGNLSIGDGSGQEDLYYCFEKVPNLPTQTYSTDGGSPWTISY